MDIKSINVRFVLHVLVVAGKFINKRLHEKRWLFPLRTADSIDEIMKEPHVMHMTGKQT